MKFSENFTCVFTILVKFDIHFLGYRKKLSLVLLQMTTYIFSP